MATAAVAIRRPLGGGRLAPRRWPPWSEKVAGLLRDRGRLGPKNAPFAKWWERSGLGGVTSACKGMDLSPEDLTRLMATIDCLPSLRTIAVAVLSVQIAWMKGIKPDKGYEFDLKHAVLASQADVFLTNDARLLRTLSIGQEQLPYKSQRPVDFLESVRQSHS